MQLFRSSDGDVIGGGGEEVEVEAAGRVRKDWHACDLINETIYITDAKYVLTPYHF